MNIYTCPRCGWLHEWRWDLRALGRAIRKHYEADHPGAEVGRCHWADCPHGANCVHAEAKP